MPEISPSRYLVQCGWDDVPHLDARTKAELLASTPPHLRDARSKGIPALGSGAIYPVAESEITCAPFEIPAWWPRLYALDVGWRVTAALWLAWDRAIDVAYAYTEYRREEAEPAIHAAAIRARGGWIPGVIDPASRGRAQADGRQLIVSYRDLGLDLLTADNSVESGLFDVWSRLSTGRLKLFSTLVHTLGEYRIYRRDERGRIVKEHDHHMDCLRYGVRGLSHAKTKPAVSGIADRFGAAVNGGHHVVAY